MKNNIEYYRHSAQSDQHPKFKMLRLEYGWAVEVKFWALNNRIAQAEGCILDITKKYNKVILATDLDFTLEDLDKFIAFLVNDCQLIFETKTGGITTEQVQENYMKVTDSRKYNQKAYFKLKDMKENLIKSHGNEQPIHENEKQINSHELIQSKVKKSKVNESKVKAPQKEVELIIDDLNKRLGTRYSSKSVISKKLIMTRLSEGFSVQDFFTVHEKKVREWKDDSEMSMYLRPETLYSNKFEGYLNQIIQEPKSDNLNKVDTAINKLQEEYDKKGGAWSNIETAVGSLPQSPNIKRIS